MPIESYRRNVEALFALAKAHVGRCIFVNSTPLMDELHNSRPSAPSKRKNADVQAYNAAASEIAAAFDVPVLDLYGFTETLGGAERYADHVHFTDEVARLQAAFLAGALCRMQDDGFF